MAAMSDRFGARTARGPGPERYSARAQYLFFFFFGLLFCVCVCVKCVCNIHIVYKCMWGGEKGLGGGGM